MPGARDNDDAEQAGESEAESWLGEVRLAANYCRRLQRGGWRISLSRNAARTWSREAIS
jgi:hypothetical protein